jgi:uncharacterized protein (DUF488 family)
MIVTVGHGTLAPADLITLLRDAGIEMVVDIRRYPGSRRWPQFGRERMPRWLGLGGVRYRWLEGLGGRRSGRPDSPNVGLRNRQFRAYADHMASHEFGDSVRELRRVATLQTVAVMCSESVWWRCHRRLLADHLVLVDAVEVGHLMHDGRVTAHPVTDGARRADGHVVYDVTS